MPSKNLTDEIESGAQEYISHIDAHGRSAARIETGYIQQEIQKSAFEYQECRRLRRASRRRRKSFSKPTKKNPIPTLRIDPEIERTQIARLHALRARRDSAKARAAVAEIERRAHTTENLMPAILNAVESYATVGEISDALRRAFGEYRESVVI